MTSYRRHGRTPLKCTVKMEHDALGEMLGETRDVSATGVFVKCRYLIDQIAVGDALRAKMCRGEDCDHPSLFTVVRLTDDGLALTYA